MRAKKLIIPEENVGAVLSALRVRAAVLQAWMSDNQHKTIHNHLAVDLAAIVMAADQLDENPVEEVKGWI